ncbi:DUF5986 family protein [Chengkuizengella sp. SCS-71B]|uniref:DUF5986 family protein n=1 Tax=Chengkuizengella sp. SCS-71B TaxID=3115290 RepID=UPI0032C24612
METNTLHQELPDEYKELIVNNIQQGIIDEYKRIKKEGLYTNVSKGSSITDYINRNLKNSLPEEEFDVYKIKTGYNHEHIQIYYKIDNTLYLLMNDARFDTVKESDREEEKRHYMKAYVLKNEPIDKEIKEKGEGQLVLDFQLNEIISEDIMALRKKLRTLTTNIQGEIGKIVIISYIRMGSKLISCFQNIPDSKLEYVDTTNWSEFIKPFEDPTDEKTKSKKKPDEDRQDVNDIGLRQQDNEEKDA